MLLVERARALPAGAPGDQQRALLSEVRALQAERGVSLLVPRRPSFDDRAARAPAPNRRYKERSCPAGGECRGSGWLLGPDDAARPCECRESRRADPQRLRRFVRRNLSLSLSAPPLAQLPDHLRAAAASFEGELREGRRPGLWIAGPTASGKTSLAVYLALAASERGLKTSFYPLHELLGRLHRLNGDRRREGEPFLVEEIERLASSDLVVIDELDGSGLARTRLVSESGDPGVRQLRSSDLDLLLQLLDELEQQEVALIVTSELSAGQLERRFARRCRADLVHSCLEAARRNDELAWEEPRIERRAELILRRLGALCGDPQSSAAAANLASGPRASLEV